MSLLVSCWVVCDTPSCNWQATLDRADGTPKEARDHWRREGGVTRRGAKGAGVVHLCPDCAKERP